MTTATRFRIAGLLGAALALSCLQERNVWTFTKALRQADQTVLYEGLPHHLFEDDLMKEERRTKAVQELNGYVFYQEPLTLTTEDARRLSAILGKSTTYERFSGEKACGGFHPDYTVEWHAGKDRYRALICLGCHEVKLFGPGLQSRNNLDQVAYEKLDETLKRYRKNRPAGTL